MVKYNYKRHLIGGNTLKSRIKSLPMAFFFIYLILMGSLIYFAMTNQNAENMKTNSKQTEVTTQKQEEISETFSKEMKLYEKKKKQKEIEQAGKWKPSKTFVIIAISLSSVLDIVIILIWAKHENRKREGALPSNRKKWIDQKWFWNIIALGIIQPKNNRLVINWKNVVVFIIFMYLLKTLFLKFLDNKSSSDQSLLYRSFHYIGQTLFV